VSAVAMSEVSTVRLHALRATYLLIALAMGSMIWPGIVTHAPVAYLMQGVARSMLGALTLLCLLGVRYPLRMLPLLLFEAAWKLIWLIAIAWPAWSAGAMDEAMSETAFECAFVVLVLVVLPWRYLVDHYMRERAERWK
jgi:hypothetical protein